MATRSIELVLKARVDGMVSGLKTAQTAASNAGRDLENFRKNQEQSFNTLQNASLKMGAGLVAGTTLVSKAAMDWQSAWAGVQKTNDGTTEQMTRLEDDLRGLAKTLPTAHSEIAATAEAAGQLGVGVDDVADFTKVMLDMGESTNLSAEEAATAIARFSNITGTAFSEASNLGSAIVGLGNNFATTEAEIMNMATNVAAAGAQAGMSEGEILGLSAAMSSVGIEAEAGGTAMTMVVNKIDGAVREGGDKLTKWAEVAGVSAQQFSEAWTSDPAAALDMVVTGLGKAGAEGESMAGILTDLGVKGIREAGTMRRLAGAGELLGEAFAMGNKEFERNTALVEEAAQRYETTESKVKMAWNNIVDAAITAGSAMLPVISGIAEHVAGLAEAFGNLPESLQGGLTMMAGIGGLALLGVGGFMKLVSATQETISAWKVLKDTAPGVATGLGRVAAAAGIAAVALVGLRILDDVISDKNGDDIDDLTDKILRMADASKDASGIDVNSLFGSYDEYLGVSTGVDTLGEALDRVTNKNWFDSLDGFAAGIIGVESEMQTLEGRFSDIDAALAGMVGSGNAEEAEAAFNRIADEAEQMGIPLDELVALFPQYGDALRDAGTAEESLNSEQVASELEQVGIAADGTVESLSEYLELLFATGLAEMSARDAQAKFYDSIRSVGDAVDQLKDPESGLGGLSAALNKNKDDFDLTTEAGALANSAFQDITRAGMDAASAMAENGAAQEDVQAQLQSTYDALVEAAGQFGITGEEAEALARSVLGIEDDVSIESWMSDTAKETADATKESVTGIPSEATIDSWMSDAAFLEALATRAAVLDIPEEDVIDSFMSDAARDEAGKTTAAVLGIPEGASISSFMSDNARKEAQSTNEWLNRIDGRHTSSQHTHTTFIKELKSNAITRPMGNLLGGPGGYTGGRVGLDFGIPRRRHGGRLPYTGLGTDMILGIGSHGGPTALVDDGEWVIRESSARKYDRALAMINQDHPSVQHLAGLASGGRVSQAERLVSTRQTAYDRISGDKENRNAKLAAKERLNAAKAELKAAKEQQKASEKAAKEAADRRKAVAEMRRDMRVDLRRGEITDAFTSGNGMSVVDRMLNMSRDENLGGWSRSLLARTSGSLEKQLTTLTKRSDALEESLKRATERRDDLLSTQQSVASSLSGEWSLGSMVTAHRRDWVVDPMNAKTIAGNVSATAARIQKFAWKMGLLRKAGFSEAVITEVSGLGTEDGIMAADILLESSKSERNAINSAYRHLDKASMYAGSEVTKNMYQGGINAAEGVVRGLESKQNAIERAFRDMAKRGERAFKSALGIKSPSRVMMSAGEDTGMGAILGVQSMIPDAEQAMRDLAAAQQTAYQVDLASSRVPVSAEVARYATHAAAPVIDYDRLSKAVGGGLTVSPVIHGAVPAELERGIVRATFRELRAQGVPVGEPA